MKYPERSYSRKRCESHLITTAKFAVSHRKSNESSVENLANAYLQGERCAIADLVVYEHSKCGNGKEIDTPDFQCLGCFLEPVNVGFRSSVGLFSRLLLSWFMHFSFIA